MNTYPPVASLLPHAAPMLLLDALLHHEEDGVVCAVTVRPDMPFVDPEAGQVATLVSLEYMAQAVAAYAGYLGYLERQAPKLGFLLGCRRLRCHQPYLPVGTPLRVEAKRTWGDVALGKFACSVTLADGTPVATASLSVVQPKEGEGPAGGA